MIVVTMELWPGGSQEQARPLGVVTITNDGTGTTALGNYTVTASHAGIYFGKRRGPYKRATVKKFPRSFSPYRLLCRALRAMREE